MAAVQRTGESVHAHGDAEARARALAGTTAGSVHPATIHFPRRTSLGARVGEDDASVSAPRGRAGSPRFAVRRDPRLGRGLHEERHEHARRAPRQSARQVVHADVHLERVRRVAARVADHARRRGSGRHVRRCAPPRVPPRRRPRACARRCAAPSAHRAEGNDESPRPGPRPRVDAGRGRSRRELMSLYRFQRRKTVPPAGAHDPRPSSAEVLHHVTKTSSVTRRHTTPRPRMCYKTTCSTCKKPTWGG